MNQQSEELVAGFRVYPHSSKHIGRAWVERGWSIKHADGGSDKVIPTDDPMRSSFLTHSILLSLPLSHNNPTSSKILPGRAPVLHPCDV
jgi:hypothetical protein